MGRAKNGGCGGVYQRARTKRSENSAKIAAISNPNAKRRSRPAIGNYDPHFQRANEDLTGTISRLTKLLALGTVAPTFAKSAPPGDERMDDLALIEGEKSSLFEHLSDNFPAVSLKAVADLAPTFCHVLCEQLRERILKHAARAFPGSSINRRRARLIDFGGKEYNIEFTTHPLTQRDKLPFVISEYGGEMSLTSLRPRVSAISLTSISQYKSIELYIDQDLPGDDEFLALLVKGVFSSGYQWLANRLTSAIRTETARISTGLYDYLRSMFAERLSLLDGFLFSCLLDGSDFVILDDLAAEGALRLADQRAERYQKPREEIVLQLISEVVGVKDSVILDACDANSDTIAIPLASDSKYYRESPEFFDSMAAVWAKEVTCHPIKRSGKLRIVAFYPSSKSYDVTPLLAVHVDTLARMAAEQSDLIHQHLIALRRLLTPSIAATAAPPERKGRWVSLSEIIGILGGTFTGRAIKNMID